MPLETKFGLWMLTNPTGKSTTKDSHPPPISDFQPKKDLKNQRDNHFCLALKFQKDDMKRYEYDN